jgi:hypothetical protein
MIGLNLVSVLAPFPGLCPCLSVEIRRCLTPLPWKRLPGRAHRNTMHKPWTGCRDMGGRRLPVTGTPSVSGHPLPFHEGISQSAGVMEEAASCASRMQAPAAETQPTTAPSVAVREIRWCPTPTPLPGSGYLTVRLPLVTQNDLLNNFHNTSIRS